MSKLIKYPLDFDLSFEYVKKTIDEANALSCLLMKILDFSKGNFFTLLPDHSYPEKKHDFFYGGILFERPVQFAGNYSYSEIPSIMEEVSSCIQLIINKDAKICCVIDDVVRRAIDICESKWNSMPFIKFYDQEIYYVITYESVKETSVVRCLQNSRSFWHSLCVISECLVDNVSKQLKLTQLEDICLYAESVVIGAYDGEGYIFWEKGDKMNAEACVRNDSKSSLWVASNLPKN